MARSRFRKCRRFCIVLLPSWKRSTTNPACRGARRSRLQRSRACLFPPCAAPFNLQDLGTRRLAIGVPVGSRLKYRIRASGMRTRASASRAEIGLFPRFLRSVLNRPSQEVRRELACGERFSAVFGSGQSTGLPRKPQETCHSARRSGRRRARLVWELAVEVRPDSNGLCDRTPALGPGRELTRP